MKYLKILFAVIVINCISQSSYGQITEVKVNVLAGAITIFNPSIEIGFGKASAITMDYAGSYAETNFMGTGYPFLATMGLFGYRHYIKNDNHLGFFIGGDFGLDQFMMNKNLIPLVPHDHAESGYDVCHGYLIGSTIGYKYKISHHFNIEASVSWGWHHSRHEGYTEDGVRTFKYNASAEWTPYKAGIYVSYVFGPPTT